MKKIILCFLASLIMVNSVRAEEDLSVYRFAVLEALIANHKALSNRLRDRTEIDASVTFGTYRTTNSTENYEDIIRTMQKRIEGSLVSVQFASDLAALTAMAVKTAQLSSNAIENALDRVGDNPMIIEVTAHVLRQSGISINTIYRLIAMAASGGVGAVLATYEDRTQFCFIIRTQLQRIQNMMNSLNRLTFGMANAIADSNTDAAYIRRVLNGSLDGNAYNEANNRIHRFKLELDRR